jgi:hypothetical protein
MDGVDLGRPRNASVDYNSKRRLTHVPRPPSLILVLSRRSTLQDRHIKPRSRLHRPTWVRQISDTRLPKGGIRTTPIRPALTYTVLPLRTAVANPSRPSCRAPGRPRPILWVGQPLRYMPRARAPRHPIPVHFLRMGTDPVPHRPSPAPARTNTPNRSLVPVPRRPFLVHLPPTAGSLASVTLMLFHGPRMSVVVPP